MVTTLSKVASAKGRLSPMADTTVASAWRSSGRPDEAAGHVGVGFDGYKADAGRDRRGCWRRFRPPISSVLPRLRPAVRRRYGSYAGFDAGVEQVVPGGEEAFAEFVVFHGQRTFNSCPYSALLQVSRVVTTLSSEVTRKSVTHLVVMLSKNTSDLAA